MVPFGAFTTRRVDGRTAAAESLQRLSGDDDLRHRRAGRSTGEAMDEMERLADELPDGFGFEWTGISYEEQQSAGQIGALLGLSLVVVFLLLAALYESWSVPLAVLLVVPLGVLGAVLFSMLRGLSADVYFNVGLITIIGLVGEERDPDRRIRDRRGSARQEPARCDDERGQAAPASDHHDLARLHSRHDAAGASRPAPAPRAASPSARASWAG